jgi:hypothetical protein
MYNQLPVYSSHIRDFNKIQHSQPSLSKRIYCHEPADSATSISRLQLYCLLTMVKPAPAIIITPCGMMPPSTYICLNNRQEKQLNEY